MPTDTCMLINQNIQYNTVTSIMLTLYHVYRKQYTTVPFETSTCTALQFKGIRIGAVWTWHDPTIGQLSVSPNASLSTGSNDAWPT